MDLQRLKELEKLAGLRLDPHQRESLLADLVQLEEFASRLPEISPVDSEPAVGSILVPSTLASLTMDRQQERSNTPVIQDGFYQIPPSDPQPDGESS